MIAKKSMGLKETRGTPGDNFHLNEILFVHLFSLVPVLLMIAYSKAADPRKIMAQMYFLLLYALIVCLKSKRKKIDGIIIFFLSLVFTLQTMYAEIALDEVEKRPAFSQNLESQFGIIRPPFTKEDPNRRLELWISSEVGAAKRIAMYSHGLLATNTYIGAKLPIVNHTGLSLASLERGNKNYYHYSADMLFGEKDVSLISILKSEGFDYLVLDMYRGPIGSEVNRDQGLFKTTNYLLMDFTESEEFLKKSTCKVVLNRSWCIFGIGD
jgi:hypothetical protein